MNARVAAITLGCFFSLGAQSLIAQDSEAAFIHRPSIAYLIDAPSPTGKQAVYGVSADGRRRVLLGPRNADTRFLGIEKNRVLLEVDHPDPGIAGVYSLRVRGGHGIQLTHRTDGDLRYVGSAHGRAVFAGYDASYQPSLVSYSVNGGPSRNLNPASAFFLNTDLSSPQLLEGRLFVNIDNACIEQVDLDGRGFSPFVTRQTSQYPLFPLQVIGDRVVVARNPYQLATEIFSVLLDGSDLRVLFDGWSIGRPIAHGTRLIVDAGLPPVGSPPDIAYYRYLASIDVDGTNHQALSPQWREDSGASVSLVSVVPPGYAIYTDIEPGRLAQLFSASIADGRQLPIYTFSNEGEGAVGTCGLRAVIGQTVDTGTVLKSIRLIDGRDPRLLTPRDASDAFLASVAGQALVLRTRRGKSALVSMRPDGTRARILVGPNLTPTRVLATNRHRLAVLGENQGRYQVYVTGLRGGHILKVYDETAAPTAFRFLESGFMTATAQSEPSSGASSEF